MKASLPRQRWLVAIEGDPSALAQRDADDHGWILATEYEADVEIMPDGQIFHPEWRLIKGW